jgi:Tfp pilus assembly PilM family ATPase
MNTRRFEKWTREDAVGLDMEHGHIVAALFTEDESGPSLKKLAIGSYDPTASDRRIAHALKNFWKKEQLPIRTVRTCLHSRALMVRYFRYENLNDEELPQALALEAEEALQKPANEISMDWHLNKSPDSDSSSKSRKERSGTLIAAPRETVVRHLKLIKAAGLYSIGVEVSCSALGNLYSFINDNQGDVPVCLINLTSRSADIIMCAPDGHYPRTLFSASKPWAENQAYLFENIQNSLLYYHLKLKKAPIEKIVLVGCRENLAVFSKQLAKETSLPVEILDICDHVNYSKHCLHADLKAVEGCDVATGLGLGLKGVFNELV